MLVSHSARSAWIETVLIEASLDGGKTSHSARSAWIETDDTPKIKTYAGVALRKECVD